MFSRYLSASLCGALVLGGLLNPNVSEANERLSGESVYLEHCASCHGQGPVDAPKFEDVSGWEPLIKEGQAIVTAHGWVGVREMPPRGGAMKLDLETFGRAVAYMGRSAGAAWPDPEHSADMMAAIQAEAQARRQVMRAEMTLAKDQGRSGSAVYEEACRHCHETGIAGAPKKGNKKAWRPLIKEGQAVLTAHAWVGVRAMPPRGGHPDLSLAEFARGVAEMASASGGNWLDPSTNSHLMARIRDEIDKREKALSKQAKQPQRRSNESLSR